MRRGNMSSDCNMSQILSLFGNSNATASQGRPDRLSAFTSNNGCSPMRQQPLRSRQQALHKSKCQPRCVGNVAVEIHLPPRLHYGSTDSAYEVFARKDRMEYALHTLDIPICHHIRLNMPEVANAVNSGCFTIYERSQGSDQDVRCESFTANEDYTERNGLFTPGTGVWKHYQKCSACALQGVDTAFAFRGTVRTHDAKKQRRIVSVAIGTRVNLGTLRSSKDPAWVLHAFQAEEVRNNIDSYGRWLDGCENELKSLNRRLGLQVQDERKAPPKVPVWQNGCSIM